MTRLPDEIISEILSPALKVADELFSDASDVSPFANPTPSTSAYLLVCKDWLRVATPLLYSVVVLRSKAQAAALQKVLRKNPDFGGFVKKLRVEGGYGMAMHSILASAPNITDLFLTLEIWSSDNTNGLCKGLPLINPRRIIVVDPVDNDSKAPKNKNQTALSQVLFSCISEWDNLEIFGFPYPPFAVQDNGEGWSERASDLMDALVESETIHTVLLPLNFELSVFFYPLLDIPGLRILHLNAKYYEWDHQERMEIIKSFKLDVSLRYMPDSSVAAAVSTAPEITPSLNPHFVPMGSASAEVQKAVWMRIFMFALSKDDGDLGRNTSSSSSSQNSSTNTQPSRLAILLVSKYFNQLALSALFKHLHVKSRNVSSIIQQLDNHWDLGSSIRSINLRSGWRRSDDSLRFKERNSIQHSIISRATKVERFCAQLLSADAFELLAVTTGSTIRKLSINFYSSSNPTVSTSVFRHFVKLQVCQLQNQATFTVPSKSAPKTVLAQLHTLQLTDPDTIMFDTFSAMRLPALHTFRIPSPLLARCIPALINFLHAHGRSLVHIAFNYSPYFRWKDFYLFDVCTSLCDAEFDRDFELRRLTCKDPHRSLAKITCDDVRGLTRDGFRDISRDADHVDPALFPALREIQCRGCRWPKTEREISKNHWVPLAETLLEKNIKLTDSAGRHWIPRLKNARGKK
ncbi:hypothetical protein C8R43DRAFT_322675 [Mycena crocata]|nr:hypothetical protein C8R43DRAFT_322675 [Mycena crocata]